MEEATQIPSDEVDQTQLALAEAEGEAYMDAFEYMINEVAHTGGIQEIQDRVIGFAQEEAEGMWKMNAQNALEWVEPREENVHIEVAVMDRDDHRFVPHADIEVTFIAENGEEHGPYNIPFVWHPGLHHYGRNLELPGSGMYDIRVHVDAPTFSRHDKENGGRYAKPVEVVFEHVDIATGQD